MNKLMLFKRVLLEKIMAGVKTQTRRSTKRKRGVRVYEIGERVGIQAGYKPPEAFVIIAGTQTLNTSQSDRKQAWKKMNS